MDSNLNNIDDNNNDLTRGLDNQNQINNNPLPNDNSQNVNQSPDLNNNINQNMNQDVNQNVMPNTSNGLNQSQNINQEMNQNQSSELDNGLNQNMNQEMNQNPDMNNGINQNIVGATPNNNVNNQVNTNNNQNVFNQFMDNQPENTNNTNNLNTNIIDNSDVQNNLRNNMNNNANPIGNSNQFSYETSDIPVVNDKPNKGKNSKPIIIILIILIIGIAAFAIYQSGILNNLFNANNNNEPVEEEPPTPTTVTKNVTSTICPNTTYSIVNGVLSYKDGVNTIAASGINANVTNVIENGLLADSTYYVTVETEVGIYYSKNTGCVAPTTTNTFPFAQLSNQKATAYTLFDGTYYKLADDTIRTLAVTYTQSTDENLTATIETIAYSEAIDYNDINLYQVEGTFLIDNNRNLYYQTNDSYALYQDSSKNVTPVIKFVIKEVDDYIVISDDNSVYRIVSTSNQTSVSTYYNADTVTKDSTSLIVISDTNTTNTYDNFIDISTMQIK